MKNEKEKKIANDKAVKDKIAATKAASETNKAKIALPKGNMTTVAETTETPKQQTQTVQSTPTTYNCKVCVSNGGKQVGEYRCTKCKLANNKKGTVNTTITQQPVQQPSANIGSAKAVTEGINGAVMAPLAMFLKKDFKECMFKTEQIEALNEVAPEGEIKKSWWLYFGLMAGMGAANVFTAKRSDTDMNIEDLQRKYEEQAMQIEHLKTYAERAKVTIKAQSEELKITRKTSLV